MARALLCPIPALSLNHKVFKYAYWWDVGQTVELLTKESVFKQKRREFQPLTLPGLYSIATNKKVKFDN